MEKKKQTEMTEYENLQTNKTVNTPPSDQPIKDTNSQFQIKILTALFVQGK